MNINQDNIPYPPPLPLGHLPHKDFPNLTNVQVAKLDLDKPNRAKLFVMKVPEEFSFDVHLDVLGMDRHNRTLSDRYIKEAVVGVLCIPDVGWVAVYDYAPIEALGGVSCVENCCAKIKIEKL